MNHANPIELIYSLIGYPSETEWLEFKGSNNEAERIGQDISALANSAAYHGRDYGYRIWGVEDGTHQLIGSSFDYLQAKAEGNQSLLIWLEHMMSSNANYEFMQFDHDGLHFVVLQVNAANGQPVYFKKAAYIREGSSTTKLKTGSAAEAELWRRLQQTGFEARPAIEDIPDDEALDHLNVDAYFELLGLQRPKSVEAMLKPLEEQGLVKRQDNNRLTISNLGALLLGRKISLYPGLRKRALRVLRFAGKGNLDIIDDKVFDEGYAMTLQRAEDYIMSVVPSQEVIEGAFRRIRHAYPQRAVRELLANAIIHQDLTATSSSPLVCVYENRIEFNNPGPSLISVDRVLNAQPKTRNIGLVNMLRLMDLCEEGGTGWDRAVEACESMHILAPRMESSEEAGTKVTLFQGGAYGRMTKRERINALYWHCCLMYAQGESMNNTSLRRRFGLSHERKNMLAISRLIRECCDKGLIKEEDEDAGAKYRRYIPAWA